MVYFSEWRGRRLGHSAVSGRFGCSDASERRPASSQDPVEPHGRLSE